MNIPSHQQTKELLRPLLDQSDSLTHQQTLIATGLGLIRAKKEAHITTYIAEVNESIANTGMSILYDTVPSFEDGTPNGVLQKAFFYLIDDGFVILSRECFSYFQSEAKFQQLIPFIKEAKKFIDSKEMAISIDSILPKRVNDKNKGKI
jgi:hypothetical protein